MQNGFPVSTIDRRQALAALLGRDVCHVAPDTPDGLMARMVAQAGFDLAYVSQIGTALNRLGSLDGGLLTASELVDSAGRCIAASGLPTLVDVGSGFGNPINVLRTVGELERAGVAGVILDDAEDPRRHRRSRATIPVADMEAKLKAARDAGGRGMVLVARVLDVEDAGADVSVRAARYRDAGADLIHVGTVGRRDAVERIARRLSGIALACDLSTTSALDAGALAPLGFRLALAPLCGVMAAIPPIENTFEELARTGTVGPLRSRIADFRRFTDIAGLPAVQKLELRYGVPDEQRTAL